MLLCVRRLPNMWRCRSCFIRGVSSSEAERSVFVSTDWDALVWFSDNPKRMAAVMKSWEGHCAHPHFPRSMAFRLSNAGFRLDGAAVFPILNLQYTDDGYSKGNSAAHSEFRIK